MCAKTISTILCTPSNAEGSIITLESQLLFRTGFEKSNSSSFFPTCRKAFINDNIALLFPLPRSPQNAITLFGFSTNKSSWTCKQAV